MYTIYNPICTPGFLGEFPATTNPFSWQWFVVAANSSQLVELSALFLSRYQRRPLSER
jgi:hypothetical protein